MWARTQESANGFTLIELLIAGGVLALALVAMGSLDLVDFLDSKSYVEGRGLDASSDSLIGLLNEPLRGNYSDAVKNLSVEARRDEALGVLQNAGHKALADLERAAASDDEFIQKEAGRLLPAARASWRERKLLVQVACRELGRQGTKQAVPALRRLAESDDYFIAKHARKALEEVESGGRGEQDVGELSAELRAILPEGWEVEVLVDARSFREEPTGQLRGIAAKTGAAQRLIEVVEKVNRTVGNVELRNFRVMRVGRRNAQTWHLVFWGRFDQAALGDWLKSHGMEQDVASEGLWAGTYRKEERRWLRVQLAMAYGRTLVCFVSPPVSGGPPQPELSPDGLVKLVKAYAE